MHLGGFECVYCPVVATSLGSAFQVVVILIWKKCCATVLPADLLGDCLPSVNLGGFECVYCPAVDYIIG